MSYVVYLSLHLITSSMPGFFSSFLQIKGFYPLHVAAALHGPEGAQITEMLLHAITEPDSRACDQEEIYQPDLVHVYFTF